MRIALAQINPTVGDFEGNKKLILKYIEKAKQNNADMVVFPELAITGYPPEDLLLRESFIDENLKTLNFIINKVRDIPLVIGFVDRNNLLYNAAGVGYGGKIIFKHYKSNLPNYGVFDEVRYFAAGNKTGILKVNEYNIGITVCEDIWNPDGPAQCQAIQGEAHLLINISASPFHAGKLKEREQMLATRASDYSAYVAYLNMVGGQDELVFDGRSMVFDESGKLIARGKAFEEDLIVFDIDLKSIVAKRIKNTTLRREMEKFKKQPLETTAIRIKLNKKGRITNFISPALSEIEEIYSAIKLGIIDYCKKNGFKKALVGVSGGIDSALTLCLAVDSLGAQNVIAISMPSMFTSKETKSDARKIADNLGVQFYEIPISEIHRAFIDSLTGIFAGTKPGIAEENIQARIRGNILMAISNKFGWLVLTTGNKSEVSTGYCTLYGDTAGGYAPLKDVPKTMVYKLAEYRNSIAGKKIIPDSIIKRAPTAELKPDQKDQDVLPPYKILDKIIEDYVEKDLSYRDLIEQGISPEYVKKTILMIYGSEYKRRQSPPGVKITPRAFGKDRRYPITNKFNEILIRGRK